MFESGAMVEYILERYGEGRLRPAVGTAESALYHQWCWFSEATLIRPLGLDPVSHPRSEQARDLADEALRKVATCLEVVDRAVSHTWNA